MNGSKSAPLSKAWIQLEPTLDGSTRAIEKQLGGVGTKAGKSAGVAAGRGFKTGFLPIAGPVAGLLASGFAIDFGKQAIDQASDLGESLNALDVVFGKNAAGVKELGKAAAANIGLANVDFNALSVQFGGFVKIIAGKGGKKIVGTLDALTTRAADFASVMNIEVPEAAQLFQSGLAGETEPLRRFGIDLSAATVEAFAYANGIGEGGKQLTEAQKVQARYGLLMESTAQTQGDFANTSTELANSQRILSAEWKNAQAELGENLLPIMKTATRWIIDTGLPGFKKFMDDLGDPSTAIGKFADSVGNFVEASKGPVGDFLSGAVEFGTNTLNGAAAVVSGDWDAAAKAGEVWSEWAENPTNPVQGFVHGLDEAMALIADPGRVVPSISDGTFKEDWLGRAAAVGDGISKADSAMVSDQIAAVFQQGIIDYAAEARKTIDPITAPLTASNGISAPIQVYIDTVVSSDTDDLVRKAQQEAKKRQSTGSRPTKHAGSTGRRVT